MHNRRPTNSLSRRLLVGAKICERYLIDVFSRTQEHTPARCQIYARAFQL